MREFIEIDGENYVTEKDYLDTLTFYENSLKKAYNEVKMLEEENKNLQEELSKLKEKYGDIDY